MSITGSGSQFGEKSHENPIDRCDWIYARLLVYGNTVLFHYAKETFKREACTFAASQQMKVCQEGREIYTLFQAAMTNEMGIECVVNTFLLERRS